MKYTEYFLHTKKRPDRSYIKDEWIRKAFLEPIGEEIQSDNRIRKWAWIEEEQKYLRIVILADGKTIHNAFFDRNFKGRIQMNIKYFEDTDTALIDFSDKSIIETKEISENVYIDIDSKGNLVSMTIEHAKKSGALSKLIYEEFKKKSA